MPSTRTAPPGGYYLGPSHNLLITAVTGPQAGATVLLDGPRDRFSSEHGDELVKDNVIDGGGVVQGTVVPGGLTGMIEVEKSADDFTEMIATNEAGYFALNPRATYRMVESYVNPLTGAITEHTFSNVVFHGLKRGEWERAGIVKVSVNFFASTVD